MSAAGLPRPPPDTRGARRAPRAAGRALPQAAGQATGDAMPQAAGHAKQATGDAMPLVVRRPVLVLVVAALATLGAVAGAVRIEPVTDFVDTVPDDPGVDAYREMVARLDGVRFVAIYMPKAEGAASLRGDGFDALVQEQGDLTAWLQGRFPGAFSHSLSAWEAMRAGNYMLEKVATAGHPRPEAYSFPEDPLRYEAVKQQVLGDASLDDVLAPDGSSAIVMVFLATPDNLEARRLSGEVAAALQEWDGQRGATGEPAASGLLVSSDYTDDRNARDLRTYGALAMGAVALALLWVVRRPANVLVCMAAVALAATWTFGAMGWLGMRINFLTLFLAPIVIGIGVDHSVHLLHRVEEERRPSATGAAASAGRMHPRGAAGRALLRTRPALVAAGVTTAGGLAVVALVPNPMFSQIAAVSALGIVFCLVAALTVVPALAALLPGPYKGSRAGPGHGNAGAVRQPGLLARIALGARRRRAIPLVAVLLVSALAVTGTSQVRIESGSAENEFPQDDPLIALQHRIESEYGAFQRAYLIVRGDLTDPQALAALHAFSERAATLPLHREAGSVADLLLADEATDEGAADILSGILLEAAGQAPSADQRLPQTREEARQRLDALFADPLWGGIAPFTITREYDLAVVAIRVDPWQDQTSLVRLRDALAALEQEMQAALPHHDVQAGGAPLNRAAIIEQTPINVAIASLGVAGAVGAVLAFMWRKRGAEGLRMAAVGVGIVLVATLWLLASVPLLDAAYRWTGTYNSAALTDMFLLAFAITVAAGIDDLVHLAARYWEARDRGATGDEAVQESFQHAGRAVTGTTCTTFVAFAVLGGVYFLQSKNLAILTAAGVLYAYVLTVLLAPAALGGLRGRSARR